MAALIFFIVAASLASAAETIPPALCRDAATPPPLPPGMNAVAVVPAPVVKTVPHLEWNYQATNNTTIFKLYSSADIAAPRCGWILFCELRAFTNSVTNILELEGSDARQFFFMNVSNSAGEKPLP